MPHSVGTSIVEECAVLSRKAVFKNPIKVTTNVRTFLYGQCSDRRTYLFKVIMNY